MILVDIQVMTLDKTYDFEIDEDIKAGELTNQIVDLIIQTEKKIAKPKQPIFLYAIGKDLVLNPVNTLRQQGIENGETLIVL